MLDTIRRIIAPVPTVQTQKAMDTLLGYISDRLNSASIMSAALQTKAGNLLVQTGAGAWYGWAGGLLVRLAANTDMAALSGVVTNAKFNVFCYFINAAGTPSTVMGVEGATLSAVKFPEKPVGSIMIGFTIINPTGTGNFTGNTTSLVDATVVPNAVHVNMIGAIDPTFLLS